MEQPWGSSIAVVAGGSMRPICLGHNIRKEQFNPLPHFAAF